MLAPALLGSCRVMAPLCLGLIVALVILPVEFCREPVHAALGLPEMVGGEVTLAVLKRIDLALIANLVLMIIGAAVGVFVPPASTADQGRTEAGMADFGRLKLRVFGSISAIAAIDLLESFINIDAVKADDVIWQIAILLTFVLSGVLLALMDWLAERN
jgi:uncharacterized protein (TIGR00645 family)